MKRLLSIALVLAACSHRETDPPKTHERAADRSVRLSGASAAYVRVEAAQAASAIQSRGFVGQVSFDERHLARLGAPVQGRVAKVAVVTGDAVKAGDVVLTIHAPDIASAQAAVAEAQTSRLVAQRQLDRATLLVNQGAGTEAERQQAEAALAQAKSEEQRAVAALTALGGAAGTSDYALKTPIDGVVIERSVAVGNVVHVDQDVPLLVIADVSTVWVLADVFEQDLARVHLGDEANVEVQSFPGRTFTGTVTQIGSALDPATRVARARVEIQNADRALRPGMFARVGIKGTAEPAVEIPSSAVLSRRDEFFVFVQRADGAFVERKVRIGEQRGAHTTITSGIDPGENVVIEGAILLDAEVNESL